MALGGIIPLPNVTPNFGVLYSKTFTTSATLAVQTLVLKILPGGMAIPATQVVMQAQGAAGGSTTILETWIGLVATSGNAYNFDGNQVQMTWNSGSASVTISPTQFLLSDTLSFTIDLSKAVLIAMNIQASSVAELGTGFGTNYISYVGTGGSSAQAGTTAKTAGYTSTNGKLSIIQGLLGA